MKLRKDGKWFAWYPVTLTNLETVWLEWVYRYRVGHGISRMGWWLYTQDEEYLKK